jgi:hypothetical protein
VNEHVNEMKLAWQGLSNEIFDVLKGPIDAAITGFTRLLESMRPDQLRGYIISSIQAIGQFGIEWASIIATIRASISQFISDVAGLADDIKTDMAVAQSAVDGLGNAFTRLYNTVDNSMQQVKASIAAGLGITFPQGGTAGSVAGAGGPYGGLGPKPGTPDDPSLAAALSVKATKEAIEGYTKSVVDLFGPDPRTIRRGEGEGGPAQGQAKPAVPQMQLGGAGKQDNQAKDAAEDAATYIKLWTAAAEKTEAGLDAQLKRHEISVAEWLASTKDALADELQDTIGTYQQELQAFNLSAQQRKAINDEMTEAIAANAVKETKAEQKAADETTEQWKQAADKVASILDSQVDSLLSGTETFATAFKNMMKSAIEDVIKELIKMAVEWAALKVLMPAFNASGVANLIPHFAEGTPYVQSTGLALIHQGEMVLPPHMNPNNPGNSIGSLTGARGAESNASGGDTHTHVHFNVSAIDHDSVASFFHDNGDHIMSSIHKTIQSGGHLQFSSFRG